MRDRVNSERERKVILKRKKEREKLSRKKMKRKE